jgi:hypothetical protein
MTRAKSFYDDRPDLLTPISGGTRYLTRAAVAKRYDCSTSTVARYSVDPNIDFPTGVPITPGGPVLYDVFLLDEADARRAARALEVHKQISARRVAAGNTPPPRRRKSNLTAAYAGVDDDSATAAADQYMPTPQVQHKTLRRPTQ